MARYVSCREVSTISLTSAVPGKKRESGDCPDRRLATTSDMAD